MPTFTNLFLSLSRLLAIWSLRLAKPGCNLVSRQPAAHILSKRDFTAVIWLDKANSPRPHLDVLPTNTATPSTWWFLPTTLSLTLALFGVELVECGIRVIRFTLNIPAFLRQKILRQ